MERWRVSVSALCAMCAIMSTGCGGCEGDQDPDLDMSTPSEEMDLDLTGDEGEDLAQDVDAPSDMPDSAEDMTTEVACIRGEGGDTQTYAVGDWQVTVDQGSGEWSVAGPGGEFASAGNACGDEDGALYRVASGTPSVQMLFGAWQIDLRTRRLMWRDIAQSAPAIMASGDSLTLSWPLVGEDGASAALEFSPHGGENQNIAVQLSTTWAEGEAGEMHLGCGEEDAFFGLGTQVTGMDLRGGTYPLWTQEQGIHKPEDGGFFPLQNVPEAAYAPMGVLHSSAGWSAVSQTDSFTEVDLCEGREDRVRVSGYRQLPGWVFVRGESPRDRMREVTDYTGRITEPPAWTFAPWHDTVGGPARVAEVARVLRENDIPSSGIWVEDWIGGQLTANGFRLSYDWDWSEETYPDLPSDIDALHADGFAFFGYFNTFVVKGSKMWDEGVAGDYLIKDADGDTYMLTDPAFREATLVDLTNPAARTWLGGYLRTAANDLEIDGWMADFTEWLPHDAVLFSGEDAWIVHNQFPLLWQELNRDVMEEVHQGEERPNDWVFWARSGWASTQGGSGGFAPTMWGGDQNTDWGKDDGLPTIIPIGAHVGMSGVPIFGSDIAGYSWIGEGDPLSTKELFFRWTALGAFHPLMRTHQGGAKCKNWSFDRDADTIAHFKRYASIHTLLHPYFDQLAREASVSGWPITRHPYFVYPEDRALFRDDHYAHFLGDWLFVAPIIEEGATSREVTLPQGSQWWPLLGSPGAPVEAGTQQAAVTEIPVYVRSRTLLPLLGEVVDSFYGADKEGVTDLEDVEGQLRLAIYGGGDGLDAETVEYSYGDRSLTFNWSGFGEQWMTAPAVDWSDATLDGESLPACDPLAGDWGDVSCHDGEAALIVIDADGVAELEFGVGNRLLIQTDVGTKFKLYRGGEAFGEWSEPTPLDQGLDSDAPPVCVSPGAGD